MSDHQVSVALKLRETCTVLALVMRLMPQLSQLLKSMSVTVFLEFRTLIFFSWNELTKN